MRHLSSHCSTTPWPSAHMLSSISEKYQSHILSLSLSGSNWGYDRLSLFNPSLPVFHHLSSDESHRLLVAGMMLSHRLLVAGMMLAPQSKCSVPGSFENETLLICIIYIQEKVHQNIPKADTSLPWCTWCCNSSLVYSFNIKLQVSGSSSWGGVEWWFNDINININDNSNRHTSEASKTGVTRNTSYSSKTSTIVSRLSSYSYCW